MFILQKMIETPHFIVNINFSHLKSKKLIISKFYFKRLFESVSSNSFEKVNNSLAALNRLYDCLGDIDALNSLILLFKNSKVDKVLLASTIRCHGSEGEKILVEELKNNLIDTDVRMAILSVLAYRTNLTPNYLELRLDKLNPNDNPEIVPKSSDLCTYEGNFETIKKFYKEKRLQ